MKNTIMKWNEKMNEELMLHVENMKRSGHDIRYACEIFCKKYVDLSTEKCRSHYYQLSDKFNGTQKNKIWTQRETDIIIEAIHNCKKKRKIEVARFLSNDLGRSAREILTQYYRVKAKEREDKIENLANWIGKRFHENVKGVVKVSTQGYLSCFKISLNFGEDKMFIISGDYENIDIDQKLKENLI